MGDLAHPDVLQVARASSPEDRSARAANVDVNITLADMLCVQQTVRSKPAVAKLLRGMSRGLRVRYAEPAPACIRIPAEVHTKFRSVNSTSKFISGNSAEFGGRMQRNLAECD